MGHLESGAAFVAEARAARRNTLATIGRPDQIVRKRDVTRPQRDRIAPAVSGASM